MKKSLLFLLSLGFSSIINAQSTKTIVNISAGHLCDSISPAEKQTISKLSLTGTIDVRDFVTMRDSMPALNDIDISGTSVVAFSGSNANINYNELDNSIPNKCFANSASFHSILLPTTITKIGDSTFIACNNLESISIPPSVNSLGSNSFQYCSLLTKVVLPSSISTIGKYAFFSCAKLKTVTIPSSLSIINDHCFYGCSSLDSITIPSTVKIIGVSAFCNCDSLKTLKISEGVESIQTYAFLGCRSLKNVEIPNSVNEIQNGILFACNELTSVKLPINITTLGDDIFNSCTNLQTVKLPNYISKIPNGCFQACFSLKNISLPTTVKSIGASAFNNCTSLETIDIPDSVAVIGASAFAECTNLSNFITPDSLTTIDSNMFNHCINLTSINLKKNITKIKSYAFYGCSKLSNVSLPPALTTIGYNAFELCNSLLSIQIPSLVTVLPKGAIAQSCEINVEINNQNYSSIDGILFDKTKTVLIQYPSTKKGEYIIPSLTTTIGDYAFNNCINLTKVTIPQTVTSIQRDAFAFCSSLKTINIPSYSSIISGWAFESCTGLTSISIASLTIGESAFLSCTQLDTIKLLSSSVSLGFQPFTNCKKISTIYLYSDIPPAITNKSFNVNYSNCTLYVKKGKTASYQSNTNWAKFNIKEMGSLLLSTSSIDLANTATNNSDIKITADTSWTASSNQTWLTLDNKSGLKGSSTLSFSVTANTGTNRTAEISVTALGSEAKIIKINQASGNGVITVAVKAGEFLTTLNNGLYNSTKELVVTGTLNALDFQYIRSMPALTKIDISGATIENNILPDYALAGISTLTTVVLPSTITSINPYAFNYCTNLTSITIPSSVTSIGISAFIKCTALSSIELPESVSTISNTAFQFCSGLTSFKIPSLVDTIMDSTFYGCTGLKSIIIPSSVTYIGNMAFADCKNIDTIYSYPAIPALTGSYRVFDGVDTTKCVLLVPFDTKNSYQKANAWKDFKNVKEFGGFWLSDSTINLTNTEGSSIKIVLKTNGSWSITNSASWLTISPTSGTGNDTITVIAKANNTGVSRSTELLITSSDAVTLKDQIEKTIKIEQLGTQTAIETINSEEVSIYPNPANTSFNINTDKHSFVELYSIDGTLLYAIQTSSTITNISTNNLSSGLYIIKITNAAKTIIKHLVVENK